MLRQHVYYSITFIPGQFTPDIWTVDLENAVDSYDTVNVINSDQWQVPENLWHRSTLFTAVTINQESFNTNQHISSYVLNSLIFNDEASQTNSVTEKFGTFNSIVLESDAWLTNEAVSSNILRTLLFNAAEIDHGLYVEGAGTIKTLVPMNDSWGLDLVVLGEGSFQGINIYQDSFNSNAAVSGISAPTVMSHETYSVQSELYISGRISWNRPTNTLVQAESNIGREGVFIPSFAAQETSSPTIFEA